jgi:predicted phage terminase large subunit-like protein
MEIAKLALEDLYFFNQYILENGSVMSEFLHREMCDFASGYRQFANGKKKRLMLEPRFTLKSTCVTIGYSLQQMMKNPNIRILIASEKLKNAATFLQGIKGYCESGEKYRQLSQLLYGKLPVPATSKEEKWTTTEIISPLRTNKMLKEPTVATGGVEVVKVGQHYDLIILDDPVSENNTNSSEQIEKVIQFYKLCLSLLDPGGRMVIIGTRWNFGDLYGYIMENHMAYFDKLVRQVYLEDGSLLFPEKLTEEFLEEQKVSQGSYIFSCQYLNSPVPKDDAIFRFDRYREWVGGYDNGMLKIDEIRKYNGENTFDKTEESSIIPVVNYLLIDPAAGEKQMNDPTAMVVVGVDEKNRWFVIDYVNKRLQGEAWWNELFRLVATYNPRRVGIETTAFQKSLVLNAKEQMMKRNQFFSFDELKPDADKVRRIQTLQPRYEAGQIIMRTGMDEMRYQMVNFPRTTHDDLIDALAYGLQLIYVKRKKVDRDERSRPNYGYISDIVRY